MLTANTATITNMFESDNAKAELRVPSPDSSLERRRYLAGRDWAEISFVLIYPVLLSLPILNVVGGILSSYALLSFVARGKITLALIGGVVSLGIGSVISIGELPPGFNLGMLALTIFPTLALAIGFRKFAQLRSAFLLMSLVTVVVVSVVFSMGAEVIGGMFDEFKELAQADAAMDTTLMSQLIATLRWLTPAMIATQAALPVCLTWYLAPTLERVFSGGKTVELATSPNFRWLTLTQWRLPQYSLGLLFVFAVGRLISDSLELEAVKRVSDNLLLVSVLVFSITGFALVEHTFRRLRVAWLLRAMFYCLAILSALPGTVFLAIVGLADTQFDLRNRIPFRTPEEL